MGVFAHYVRLQFGGILGVFLNRLVSGIHRAVDIREGCTHGLFVLYGTGRVLSLDQPVGFLEVDSVAGLVSQRPHYYRRMVEIDLDVALVALQVGELKVLAEGQGAVPVAHSVGLHVGFRHHVQAVLVTQVVQVIVVRIMAGAYGVYVEFLHYTDILEHALAGHHVSAVRVQFVAVYALYEHRLAVYQQLRAGYLHFPETYLERYHLSAVTDPETVQVRIFRAPFADVEHVEGGLYHGPPLVQGPGEKAVAIGVQQFKDHGIIAFCLDLKTQGSVDVVRVKVSGHAYVVYPVAVAGVHVTVAGNSAEAEEILVLKVGAVAPAEDLQGYQVLLPRLHVAAYVKLCLYLAVFAVSHIAAVHPYIDI